MCFFNVCLEWQLRKVGIPVVCPEFFFPAIYAQDFTLHIYLTVAAEL